VGSIVIALFLPLAEVVLKIDGGGKPHGE